MATIDNNADFIKSLASLSLSEQRQIGAKFLARVLKIAPDKRLENLIKNIDKPVNSAEELHAAYQTSHVVYIETHPHSDLGALDFKKQSVHLFAEACMACVAPTYHEISVIHVAQKVAMYCRMAVTCANMAHDDNTPSFALAENEVKNVIEEQYAILNDFLNKAQQ